MRRRLVAALKPLGGFAVENMVLPGTPDVACTAGWVECKWVPRWPVLPTTNVPVPHFRPEQKVWLTLWAKRGGRAWLLLLAEKEQEWLLIEGGLAAIIVGRSTVVDLRKQSVAAWVGRSFDKEIAGCLLAPAVLPEGKG